MTTTNTDTERAAELAYATAIRLAEIAWDDAEEDWTSAWSDAAQVAAGVPLCDLSEEDVQAAYEETSIVYDLAWHNAEAAYDAAYAAADAALEAALRPNI